MGGVGNSLTKWFGMVWFVVGFLDLTGFKGHGSWVKPWFVTENHSSLTKNRSFWPVSGKDKTCFAALYSGF